MVALFLFCRLLGALAARHESVRPAALLSLSLPAMNPIHTVHSYCAYIQGALRYPDLSSSDMIWRDADVTLTRVRSAVRPCVDELTLALIASAACLRRTGFSLTSSRPSAGGGTTIPSSPPTRCGKRKRPSFLSRSSLSFSDDNVLRLVYVVL